MSRDKRQAPDVAVEIQAAAGVSFRVLGPALEMIAGGTGTRALELPPGLYAVEWLFADVMTETLVRLTGRETAPVLIRFDPSRDGTLRQESHWPGSDPARLVSQALRPSEQRYGSSIEIVVAAAPGTSAGAVMGPVRLVDRDDVPMRANDTDRPEVALQSNEAARCYRVKPGRYRLRYPSLTGQLVDQMVPALADRSTILFLQATTTNLVVAGDGGIETIEQAGIDPTRSVIISIHGTEGEYRIRERLRLAGLLLHDLTAGTSSLDAALADILDDPLTDPLLKLYGAVVALGAMDAGRSPIAGEPWPRTLLGGGYVREDWAYRIAQWVAHPRRVGMPSDMSVIWWRLGAYLPVPSSGQPILVRPSQRLRTPAAMQIKAPPMLETCWRWAIAESVARPRAIMATPSLTAAGRSAGGATPWLSWSPDAAKAPPPARSDPGSRDIDALISRVADKASKIRSDRRPTSDADQLPAQFSGEGRATLIRISQLDDETRTGTASEALAASLAVPSRQLGRRLVAIDAELDRLLFGRVEASAPAEPPALRRAIKHLDDPQKGRFGGRSRVRGYALEAKFAPGRTRDITRISLAATGPLQEQAEVIFCLHDSFKPQTRVARAHEGRAAIEVAAWGGFTVGVWLADDGVELELDLAKIRGAPKAVRKL